MKNKVYIEAFDAEQNNKIDLIRQFVGIDSYEYLSTLFYKIENGLHISDREKWHLQTYYGYEAETMTVSEIEEYVNLFYRMFENTLKMSKIEFKNAIQDAVVVFKYEVREGWRNFKNKCAKKIKRFFG